MLAEDTALLSLSHRLVQPLVERIKRHPLRSIRPETIDALIREWREMTPVVFSLDFAVTRSKHGCIVTERRIAAAEMTDDDDPEVERIVSVGEVEVSIDRNKLRQDHRVRCVFPLRCLAERIGWCGPGDAGMIRAIDAAARFDVTRIPEDRAVAIPTQDGAWRARAIRAEIAPGVARRLIRCHAWVPA